MGDENQGIGKQSAPSGPVDAAAGAQPRAVPAHHRADDPPREGAASIACDLQAPLARAPWRARLLALRRATPVDARHAANQALLERLDGLLGDCVGQCLGLYWPVRGEPDLGAWPERWIERGATLALPVVQAPEQPLAFEAWWPGAPMTAGAFGIPQPVGQQRVHPDILVVPCLGFTQQGLRLGYGGGFYDRTLAQWSAEGRPRPRAYGVAWDEAHCPGLQPWPTDWLLDAIVTPSALWCGSGRRHDTGSA